MKMKWIPIIIHSVNNNPNSHLKLYLPMWVTVESVCWPLCVLHYLPPLTRATRTDHSVAAFPHIDGCSGSVSSVSFSSRREGGVPIKGVNDRLYDFKEDALLSADRHNSTLRM